MLRYVVERTLEGRTDELKEYALGVDVFGRGASFDPRVDTIVRVQARRLRSKLEGYYNIEGRMDPLLIEIPKGRYIISFRQLPPPVASPPTASAAASPDKIARGDASFPSAPVGRRRFASRSLLGFLAAAAALSVIAVGSLLYSGTGGKGAKPPAITSLAVLPLENLSGDPDQEYLADAMTEALIGRPLQHPSSARHFPHVGDALQRHEALSAGDCQNARGGRDCRRIRYTRGRPDSRACAANPRND
jgi:hypothetical protein